VTRSPFYLSVSQEKFLKKLFIPTLWITRVARCTFSKQKSQFGCNFEGLGMDYVGIFYGHSVYFVVIWYIFLGSGMMNQEKSGNPVDNI
jgi:hypothetical protein